MKNLRSILAALVVLLMATAVHAQRPTLKANVPFNFAIDNRIYPAGEYLFRISGHVINVTNTEEAKTEITLSNACESVTPTADSKLIFDRMGGYYFLRQVWVAGFSQGRELPRNRTEVRLAQNDEKQESVIIAANISR